MKALYTKDGYDLAKVAKAKQIEVKQAEIEDKKHKIDFAENINILADTESEKVYDIDASKFNVIEEKHYNF